MRQYAVIGLGKFGASVACTLAKLGHQVLAVDIDEDKVQQVADGVTHAVQADATDEDILRAIGIRNFDVVIVTIGHEDVYKRQRCACTRPHTTCPQPKTDICQSQLGDCTRIGMVYCLQGS